MHLSKRFVLGIAVGATLLAQSLGTSWTYASITDGTIDPNGVSNQYAWSDNAGWINFQVDDAPSEIHVTDAGLTGFAWSQNFGWINMSPPGSGVSINDQGSLSGSAWGENLGFIDFSGVSINDSGIFEGTASGPAIGTINFDCANCTVETDYRPTGTRGGRSRNRGSSQLESESSVDDSSEDSTTGTTEDDSQDADQSDQAGDTRGSAPEEDGGEQSLDGETTETSPGTPGNIAGNGGQPLDGSHFLQDSLLDQQMLDQFLLALEAGAFLPDIDDDGILNFFDDDIDGDGIPNTLDQELDLESELSAELIIGLGNAIDFDGDFVANADDSDLDGDGVLNFFDEDLDGDGIPNGEDDDRDQDGIPNQDDFQPDGRGQADDIDGDRVQDVNDRDRDGDGIPNDEDLSDAYDVSPQQLRRRALLMFCIDHLTDLHDDPEKEAIRFLLQNGLFLCPVELFEPEGPVTRADAIKLNALSLGIENALEEDDEFWFSYWKRELEHRGILSQDISPERFEVKVDILAFIAKSKGIDLNTLPKCDYVTYLDVPIHKWYCPLVQYFERKGWIERSPLLYPYGAATRSWVAGVLYRAFFTMP